MSEKDKRAKAEKTKQAQAEWNKALAEAEKVVNPWHRCHELARVALFAPDSDIVRVADKALQAAQETQEGRDLYRPVVAAAWPVEALIICGKTNAARKAVEALVHQAQQIEHPVSKVAALDLLWHATYSLDDVGVKKSVLDALLAACANANSWRVGRTMGLVVWVVASDDKTEAQRIAHTMRESRYKRRAQKWLDTDQSARIGHRRF